MEKFQIIGEVAPAWARAFTANWRKVARVGCYPLAQPAGGQWLAAVEVRARQLADADRRAVPSEDHLRRAATWIATADLQLTHGHRSAPQLSWKLVDARQSDHLLTLLELMIDPLNIAVVNLWLDPRERSRSRMVRRILGRGLAEPRLRAICAAANVGNGDWRGLPMEALQRLLRIVLTVR